MLDRYCERVDFRNQVNGVMYDKRIRRIPMRCPRCDANINDEMEICRFCGQDLSIIYHVRRISNAYYNMGLEKAQVRDLSGAVMVLKKSAV